MRTVKHTLYVLLTAILLTAGCKSAKVDCRYEILPYRQVEKGGPLTIADSVVAYAIYGDTSQWSVLSYEDAAAGVFTSRYGSQTRNADLMAEQDSAGWLVFPSLQQLKMVMVVCDRADTIFAWRQSSIEENLPYLNVKMCFQPWQTDSTFLYAKWNMVLFHPRSTSSGSTETPTTEP